MQGGKREGSGRRTLPDSIKKTGHNVYFNTELQENILAFGKGNSFSEKCANLILQQIELIKENQSNKIKYIDLFAGIGGLRLGFQKALENKGIESECIFSSEIKPYAVEAYKKYFKENYIAGDITKIKSESIGSFDFLLAGFPCQPFSTAGNGLGFSDTRGTLFFEIERILNYWKPYGFILENVEGLINHDKGNTLSVILDHLRRLDYEVTWKMLDGQHFGCAQSRKRVYIVGTKNQTISLDNFPLKTANFGDIMEKGKPHVKSTFTKCLFKNYTPNEVIGKAIKDKRGGKDNIHSWEIELKGKTSKTQREFLNLLLKERRKKKWADIIGIKWMDGMPLTLEQIQTFYTHPKLQDMLDDLVQKGYLKFEHPRKQMDGKRVPDKTKPKGYNIVAGKLSFEFTKILDPEKLAPTLVATDVSRIGVVDGNGLRRLSIREGQRLNGFPDDYDLSFLKENEAFDLLGNTVCVPVIQAIAERLTEPFIQEHTELQEKNKEISSVS